MPTTVAQFDHDARVIVIPINAKKYTMFKNTHTHAHTHAAITKRIPKSLSAIQQNMKEMKNKKNLQRERRKSDEKSFYT